MSFEWALEPVSEEAPCGPNLDRTDDPDFLDYYFDALGRLPERYVIPGMETDSGKRTEDRIFDPKTIDIKVETERVHGLLERSRDIRLLTLQAQFDCLAGRTESMADAIETIANLLDAFGDAVHPAIEDDAAERRDVLAELAQPITIVTGLRYMGLTGGAEVTLRKLQVADGEFAPHTGEENLSSSAMRDALGSASNRQKVDAVHAALLRMTEALRRIVSYCRTQDRAPFAPSYEPTFKVLDEMRAAITAARPDLRGAEADFAPSPEPSAQGGAEQSEAPNEQPGTSEETSAPLQSSSSVSITNHNAARQALIACEAYFQTYEPSSAALLLVRQARHLIGKPLVAAMEALLPEDCGKALVSFGPQTGFVIPAQRLKSLSEDNLPIPSLSEDEANMGPPPQVERSSDVAGILRAVEEFFRNHDKSSPVPILLQRARTYLDKDFQTLIDELIPPRQ